MTGEELQEAASDLGSQGKLARFLRVEPSSVSRWLAGIHPIPGTVDLVFELRTRLAAANSRAEMLHDSIEDFLQHGRRPLLRDALEAYREDMEAGR